MRPQTVLLVLLVLATACSDVSGPAPERGEAAPAPSATPAPAATADKDDAGAPTEKGTGKLPRVIYYVISDT